MAGEDLLIFRSANRLCALPVAHVAETLRVLPAEPVAGAPAFIAGATLLRGKPTPAIDLSQLLAAIAGNPRRTIVLKLDSGRHVGLLVDEVIGLRASRDLAGRGMPPLLAECAADTVSQLARLDSALLTVLKLGNLVPDGVWAKLAEAAT